MKKTIGGIKCIQKEQKIKEMRPDAMVSVSTLRIFKRCSANVARDKVIPLNV
jgi:hypothetical protein